MSDSESSQALLDSLITALLRDEDWRALVSGPLDPEIEQLMTVAESIHRSAGAIPKPTPRNRFRVWDRVLGRPDRPALEGDAAPSRGLLFHGFTSRWQWRLPGWRLGARGKAPGNSPHGREML